MVLRFVCRECNGVVAEGSPGADTFYTTCAGCVTYYPGCQHDYEIVNIEHVEGLPGQKQAILKCVYCDDIQDIEES